MTDAEKINNLMDTQCVLIDRLRRIARIAEIYGDQVGDGPLLSNVRFGFRRITEVAQGAPELSAANEASMTTLMPLLNDTGRLRTV